MYYRNAQLPSCYISNWNTNVPKMLADGTSTCPPPSTIPDSPDTKRQIEFNPSHTRPVHFYIDFWPRVQTPERSNYCLLTRVWSTSTRLLQSTIKISVKLWTFSSLRRITVPHWVTLSQTVKSVSWGPSTQYSKRNHFPTNFWAILHTNEETALTALPYSLSRVIITAWKFITLVAVAVKTSCLYFLQYYCHHLNRPTW